CMDDVLCVIDDIAYEANIVVLSVAVVAAPVGDQGRGIVAVSPEVRSLADRNASVDQEIEALIVRSMGKVERGSELAGRAGTTMQDIVGSVRQVTTIMNEIAMASQEQSQRIEQVNQVISEMEQGTQQNAALVEEAAAASQAMEGQARHLAQQVQLFRIGLEDRRMKEHMAGLPQAGEPGTGVYPSDGELRLRMAA